MTFIGFIVFAYLFMGIILHAFGTFTTDLLTSLVAWPFIVVGMIILRVVVTLRTYYLSKTKIEEAKDE